MRVRDLVRLPQMLRALRDHPLVVFVQLLLRFLHLAVLAQSFLPQSFDTLLGFPVLSIALAHIDSSNFLFSGLGGANKTSSAGAPVRSATMPLKVSLASVSGSAAPTQ